MSVARLGGSATSVGSKALIAGGSFTAPNVVDILDDSTGSWSTTTLSQPASGAATTVGRKALIGGADVIHVFDDATGMWTLAPLSQPREQYVAATLNDRAYFAGGWFTPGNYSDAIDVYNDSTGAWTTKTLPVAQAFDTAAAIGTKVMFATGSEVVIYDESDFSWTTVPFPTAIGYCRAVTVGTQVVFAGATGVEIYDDTTGTWTTAQHAIGRRGFSATRLGTRAMFAGGEFLGVAVTSETVDIYDSTSGQWSFEFLPQARIESRATAVGTKALFAGGSPSCGPSQCPGSNTVYVYDDAIGMIYCSPAVTNSSGHPATITAQGLPGAAAQGAIVLAANQLPAGQFGYFLAGQTQGSMNPPGSQGILCLAGNIGRFNALASIIQGPSATLEVDLSAIPVNPPQAVQPGETWNFQCWYRDNNPTLTSNFTDAVSVVFQ